MWGGTGSSARRCVDPLPEGGGGPGADTCPLTICSTRLSTKLASTNSSTGRGSELFHDWPHEPIAAALPGTTVLFDAAKLEPGRWSSWGSGRREPSGS